MRDKFGKRRLSVVILTVVMMLSTAFFAVSCGNSGGTSDGGSVVIPNDDSKTFAADNLFPDYKADAPSSLTAESLKQRRDALIVGITGYDASRDGGKAYLDEYKDVKGYTALFEEAAVDSATISESRITYNPDPKGKKLDELISAVNVYLKDGASETELSLAAEMLYGNVDLNGLYGIYQTAYRFYSNYVYSPAASNQDGNGGFLSSDEYKETLAGYNRREIISEATLVIAKQLKIDGVIGSEHKDCTTECNAAYAEEYVKAFKETTLQKIISKNETAIKKLGDAKETITYYYEILYNADGNAKYGKYEDETVNASGLTAAQVVYGENKTVDEAKALAARDYGANVGAFQAMFSYTATSEKDFEKFCSDLINAYFSKATTEKGLKTYAEAAKAKVDGFGKTETVEKTDSEETKESKLASKIDELEKIEEYLAHFDNLGEYELNLSSGAITIDLKTACDLSGEKSDGENADADKAEYGGADYAAIKNIINRSVGLTKDVVNEIKSAYAGKYGISADATISDNVAVAHELADKLTSRYGEEKSNYTCYQIATNFKSCYGNRFKVLQSGEKSTVWLNKFENVATIEYKPSGEDKIFTLDLLNDIIPANGAVGNLLGKIFPKENIPSIKLTAIDKDGNAVNVFDKNAKLNVRFGASPAVERNINLILNDQKKSESAQSGFTDGEKKNAAEILKTVRSLRYYVTLSVMLPASTETENGSDTSYIAMTESELDDIKASSGVAGYKLEFTFDKEKVDNASEFVALGYEHSKIKFVCKNEQEIKDGDEDIKMAVFLNDVATSVSMGIATPDTFKNIALYVAIGIIAVILIICIVCIIVANVRRKKYRVKYDATGGRFGDGQKVKLCKNLVYPNNPTKKGYRFVGWYLNRQCTKRFEAIDKSKNCTTVYAKWVPASRYDKIEEAQDLITKRVAVSGDYRGKANGTYGTGVHQAVYDDDPRIMKLEIEKLSYEAKKAEEERKAEEVRLQTIREIEAAKGSDEAKERAEKEAERAKLALQQALAEREALISLAKAEERAKILEEMKAEQDAKAEDEARRKEAEELKNRIAALEGKKNDLDEEKVAEIVDSKLKEYDEQRAKELEAEKARLNAEMAKKIAEEQARAAALLAAEKAAEEEANKFSAAKAFDELKAELLSFKSSDDLDFGLTEKDVAATIKVDGETVVLEVDQEKTECESKGFKVESGAVLPAKKVIANNDDVKEAKELIEEVLYAKGLMKVEKAAVEKCSDDERLGGFELDLAKERIASSADEYLKLIRAYAKSFVAADDPVDDKLLMKAFIARGKVFMYLNYAGEGVNAADGAMKAEGLGSFVMVKSADDCKKAIATIGLMMRENGLVRYPSATSIKEDASDKGFSYTLKA